MCLICRPADKGGRQALVGRTLAYKSSKPIHQSHAHDRPPLIAAQLAVHIVLLGLHIAGQLRISGGAGRREAHVGCPFVNRADIGGEGQAATVHGVTPADTDIGCGTIEVRLAGEATNLARRVGVTIKRIGATGRGTRHIEAVLVDEHTRSQIEVALEGKP